MAKDYPAVENHEWDGQWTTSMRRCPACKGSLGMSFVCEMKHVTKFLCPHCWATVRLDPSQFLRWTVGGALAGVGAVFGFAIAIHASPLRLGDLWGLPVVMSAVAGRFLPRLNVEDPPLT